jgi:hypothetical protein
MVTLLFEWSQAEIYSAYHAIGISAASSGMLRGAFMRSFDEATRGNQQSLHSCEHSGLRQDCQAV